jgi:NhaP-type Na+/H+ or K+/H+ antiporter
MTFVPISFIFLILGNSDIDIMNTPQDGDNGTMVGGIIAAVVLALLIVAGITFCCYWRNGGKQKTGKSINMTHRIFTHFKIYV